MHEAIVAPSRAWCILRTSGQRTISVARSLAAAGFEVWTPIETRRRRKPRSKATVEIDVPIMPTFIFARSDQHAALAAAQAAPISQHPPFSIFRYHGRVPLVADRDIAALRAAEDRAARAQLKTKRHVFPVGQAVKVQEGAAAGMSGVVEAGDGKFALVCFAGRFRMKIATFFLRTDEVQAPPTQPGVKPAIAALAA